MLLTGINAIEFCLREEFIELYEKMYKELIEINEVAAAKKLCCYIHDVDCELKWAQRKHINLVSSDYSIGYILGEQDHLHDWYKKRMKHYDKY